MFAVLILLGWIALVVGIVLIVAGYTVSPPALRPGFGALILGVILLLIGYLVPVATVPADTAWTCKPVTRSCQQ